MILRSPAAPSAWARTGTIRRRRRSTASRSTASGSTARRSPTGSSASSSRRPATSPSRRSRPTRRTIPARCRTCSRRARSSSRRRSMPVDLRDWSQWWTLQVRRQLAPALRAGQLDQRARRSSGRACRLSRRRSLCELGRQGTADRSRVGVRRARRARRRRVRLGRRVHAGGRQMANTWQGDVPVPEPAADGLRADLAGRRFPAERLRPLRHDRQCLGVDRRLVFAAGTRPMRRRPAASRENPRGGGEDGSYDPRQPQIRSRARC